MKTILIVEDDPAIRVGLEDCLKEEHYNVFSAYDGEKALKMAIEKKYDLMILDLLLPTKNGLEICRELRNTGNKTPILILTSKSEETDKVLGLELGADDYVTKPFSIKELLARVKALLRRSSAEQIIVDEYNFDGFYINFKNHELRKNNFILEISTTEMRILKFFIEHKGEVISRNQLLEEVWGYDVYPTTRTVDNYVLSLRKLIEKKCSEPKHIITIPKAGYKFVP